MVRRAHGDGLQLHGRALRRADFGQNRIRRAPYDLSPHLGDDKAVDDGDDVAHRLRDQLVRMLTDQREDALRIGQPCGTQIEWRGVAHFWDAAAIASVTACTRAAKYASLPFAASFV